MLCSFKGEAGEVELEQNTWKPYSEDVEVDGVGVIE